MNLLLALVLLVSGNSATSYGGRFADGLLYYLGTNITAGSLTATFTEPCRDLMLETGVFWPLAQNAEVVFYRNSRQVGTVNIELTGDEISTVVFNKQFDKFKLTNTTPDPEGVNDLATMTIKGAWCKKGK